MYLFFLHVFLYFSVSAAAMLLVWYYILCKFQKQPPSGDPRKRCAEICCIFSEHLFLETPLDGCFLNLNQYNS